MDRDAAAVTQVDQTVTCTGCRLTVEFEEGEDLLTEISAKFTPERVDRELRQSGFVTVRSWTDSAGDFMVALARPDR